MRKNKFSRNRTKKLSKSFIPGFVEVDCVIMYINNERKNFVCYIDICTKLAHIKKVPTISSKQALLAFKEFEELSPHKVHTFQTDNCLEFFKLLHKHLKENNVKYQFIYSKLPNINGVVERFNRTIQEEFISSCFPKSMCFNI